MPTNNTISKISISEKDNVLFLVASPFQVLCAYEAIKFWGIKNFMVLVIYNPADLRTNQLFNTLQYFNLEYKTFIAENTNKVFDVLIKKESNATIGQQKYNYIFVGDYPSAVQRSLAIRHIKKRGQIIYTDDGNTSLLILLNKKDFSIKARLFNSFFSLLSLFKRIKKDIFFSTYANVQTKKTVIPNNLESLRFNDNLKKGVFFIGTNSIPYCEVHHIKINSYYNLLEKILTTLKMENKEQKCYYVFHGRDIGNAQIKNICTRCGFETLKLDQIIEMYFIEKKIEPLIAAGFTSSALFNLKKIFPQSEMVNISIKTNIYTNKEYETISQYYRNNGIKEKKIILNDNDESTFTTASFQA